eukprot:jgi/Tetstr1/421942/TSEL_012841.t1
MADDEDDGLMLNFTTDGVDETADGALSKAGRQAGKKRLPFYEAKKLRLAAKRAGKPQRRRGNDAGAKGEIKDNRATQGGKEGKPANAADTPGGKPESMQSSKAAGVAPEEAIEEAAEEEDIMAAVSFAMSHEKAIETKMITDGIAVAADTADDSNSNGDTEGDDSKTVSFMSRHDQQNYKLASGPKRKQAAEEEGEEAPSKRQKPKATGIGSVRTQQGFREGELMHTRLDMSDAERQELFGDIDASSFRGLGLAESLCEHLEAINFAEPTKVQSASIPWLLKGRDALVNAPTGSGKTLAYLAPVVHSLQGSDERLHRHLGTHAIVMAPTRELVVQINDVLSILLRRYHWLVGGLLMGGEQRQREKARLRKGVMILIATPGRLLDHLQNTESFRTSELKWLIMDEADRLLDLGFEKKVEEIVGILDRRLEEARTGHRQTALFSATMHGNLGKLATLSLRNPVAVGFRAKFVDGELYIQTADRGGDELEVGGQEAAAAKDETTTYQIPSTLKQSFIEVPCKLRAAAMLAFIGSQCRPGTKTKMVVFLSSCDTVDFAYHLVNEAYPASQGSRITKVPVLKLHGNMPQDQRLTSFLTFTKQSAAVLLCTDVAARGLDFPEVTSILQFDPPGAVSEYVHRVGRAARMGRKGEATLFLMPSEMEYISMLQEVGASLEKADMLQLLNRLPRHPEMPPVNKRAGQSLENHPLAWDLQQRLVKYVSSDPTSKEMAQCAFRTFVRAYSTHPRDLKPIFHPKRLHLGHLAQSFNLRDTPTMMGQSASKAEKVRRQKAVQVMAKNKRKSRPAGASLHSGTSKLKLNQAMKMRKT